MSIPLSRLYHYIENIAEEIYGNPVIIYHFYPHGSKKLEELWPLRPAVWAESLCLPNIYCHDQEPLDFDYYESYKDDYKKCSYAGTANLRKGNIYDCVMLLHSEKRSANLVAYQQNQYISIYYWNHAILSLDWFRYAQHISVDKKPVKQFLIYNRAWSGTREYRLKFADLLIEYQLVDHCQTSVGFSDQGTHYNDYAYANTNWKPTHSLEQYFSNNITTSNASAEIELDDYANTDIEIVLETLFEDDRLHLTEKSLRPIACGQPFMLAATHGSLEYLRSYGFKTFGDIIDETYDTIVDPKERLVALIKSMKEISAWSPEQYCHNVAELKKIADYNKQHFFSGQFFQQVITELKQNLSCAFAEFESTKSTQNWVKRWNKKLQDPDIIEMLEHNQDLKQPTKTQFELVYQTAMKYYNHLI